MPIGLIVYYNLLKRLYFHFLCTFFWHQNLFIHIHVRIFQFSSVAQSFPTLCDPMDCSTPGSLSITNSQSLLKLMSIQSVMIQNHVILCRPLLLLPSIFSRISVFSNESVLCIRWPRYWSFSFRISPSNEYSGYLSFRMDWFDLLAVQGTLKSLLQHFRMLYSGPFIYLFS